MADINTTDPNNKTALILASRGSYTKLVKMLLENGAQVNRQDDDDKSALMYAQGEGYTEIIKLLKSAGAK